MVKAFVLYTIEIVNVIIIIIILRLLNALSYLWLTALTQRQSKKKHPPATTQFSTRWPWPTQDVSFACSATLVLFI